MYLPSPSCSSFDLDSPSATFYKYISIFNCFYAQIFRRNSRDLLQDLNSFWTRLVFPSISFQKSMNTIELKFFRAEYRPGSECRGLSFYHQHIFLTIRQFNNSLNITDIRRHFVFGSCTNYFMFLKRLLI